MKLSKSEEELMNHLWKLEKGILKDLINAYQDPKPATTTIATLLKRMQVKEFIDYTQVGRTREYFPLINKQLHIQVYKTIHIHIVHHLIHI